MLSCSWSRGYCQTNMLCCSNPVYCFVKKKKKNHTVKDFIHLPFVCSCLLFCLKQKLLEEDFEVSLLRLVICFVFLFFCLFGFFFVLFCFVSVFPKHQLKCNIMTALSTNCTVHNWSYIHDRIAVFVTVSPFTVTFISFGA